MNNTNKSLTPTSIHKKKDSNGAKSARKKLVTIIRKVYNVENKKSAEISNKIRNRLLWLRDNAGKHHELPRTLRIR